MTGNILLEDPVPLLAAMGQCFAFGEPSCSEDGARVGL